MNVRPSCVGFTLKVTPSSFLWLAPNPSHISHPGFFHIRRRGLESGEIFMRALSVCYVKIPLQGFLASSLRKGATARPLGESDMCPLVGLLGGQSRGWGCIGHWEDTWAPGWALDTVSPREALLDALGWLPRAAEGCWNHCQVPRAEQEEQPPTLWALPLPRERAVARLPACGWAEAGGHVEASEQTERNKEKSPLGTPTGHENKNASSWWCYSNCRPLLPLLLLPWMVRNQG